MTTMRCPNAVCPDILRSGFPGEYRQGIALCPKCGTGLVRAFSGRVGWESDGLRQEVFYYDYVPACTLCDVQMVPLAKSLLEAEGIRFHIRNYADQHFYGAGAVGTGYNLVTGPPVVMASPNRVQGIRELLCELIRPRRNGRVDLGNKHALNREWPKVLIIFMLTCCC